jgi:hypothetical protein
VETKGRPRSTCEHTKVASEINSLLGLTSPRQWTDKVELNLRNVAHSRCLGMFRNASVPSSPPKYPALIAPKPTPATTPATSSAPHSTPAPGQTPPQSPPPQTTAPDSPSTGSIVDDWKLEDREIKLTSLGSASLEPVESRADCG